MKNRIINLIMLMFACFALLPAAQPAPKDNTALGSMALSKDTTGTDNTALGFQALPTNTAGGFNTATGSQALFSNTTGLASTAVGFQALYSTTNTGSLGFGSTAIGYQALRNSTATGDNANGNTATGYQALFSDTTGDGNTADGVQALYSNTTGTLNTASGRFALFANTEGIRNTAVGGTALGINTTGSNNTGLGRLALYSNTTGSGNTAVGFFTMFNDGNPTSFFGSTAVGNGALYYNTTDYNIGLGVDALANNASGSTNIGLGVAAGFKLANGGNNIYIGNFGVSAAESNTIRIGYVVGDTVDGVTVQPHTATFIAGIHGATTSDAGSTLPVYVDMNGNLGTAASSERFKKDIGPMAKSSEAVLALRPVTFHYKNDSKGIPQFGLVAEEVAKVSPDLVVHDAKGQIYTVRYDAVNAMLLNEFLKEHRTVQELKSTVSKQEVTAAQQQKGIKALTAALKEQAAQIQKVSAQLELQKPSAQTVVNNQ